MNRVVRSAPSKSGSIPRTLDWILGIVSFYAIPIVIGLISFAALFLWHDMYAANPYQPLELRVLAPTTEQLSVSEARQRLVLAPTSKVFDTKLSELPIWFSFVAPAAIEAVNMVEFPSRHAISMACWESATLRPLGNSPDGRADGAIASVKAGFALKLEHPGAEVICKTAFVGPARLSADLWSADQLDISNRDYHRKSGLIDGGLLVLAVFVLITAAINREALYVLFAAWLFVTVRISATTGGWDEQWLNHAVPTDWLSEGRSITRAVWALLTVTLFSTLFQRELKSTRFAPLVRIAQWLCLALLPAALILPRSVFLTTSWWVGGVALALVGVSIINIVYRTRSRAAFWYGSSLAVTVISTLAEIATLAVGRQDTAGSVHSFTALASGLLASFAIAEQMRHEHQQRLEAQAELQQTFEAVPVGLFSLDMEGHFMSANPALLKMLMAESAQAIGKAWHQYFSMDSWTRLQQLVHGEIGAELEIQEHVMPGGGAPRSYLVKAILVRGKIEGSLQDVTEKVRATGHLQFLADNDSLTRSLNRRGIEKELEHAMARLSDGQALALAYLDLDRFKLINDLYGRNVGDEVLQHVCHRANNVLSGNMHMGRLGGDEFLLVLPDTQIELASLICQRIIASLSGRPYDIDDKAFHVRGSIGLIEVTAGTSIKDAISTADRACREAKAGHGEGLVVYGKGSSAFLEYEAEIRLVALLATPAITDGLYLAMQPIMSLSAPHDSLNFEVLLRMNDPQGRPIRTDQLIKAAESSGRMGVIDRWVLSTTLAWLNANYQSLQHTKFICMNLNGASLNDERFLDDVVAMLARNRHVAHHLCYEVTESVALHDLENTCRFIDRVRSFGAKVALDDFGAGYTSFSYLKDLPADMLKIDGSFIVDMNQHPANIAIVEAIVSLANNLGMKVIAEWAEDVATVQTLKEIGVDYVQGFVVARPQSPDQLLTATSSASFIQDEELVRLVDSFGKSDGTVLRVDFFEPPPLPSPRPPKQPH